MTAPDIEALRRASVPGLPSSDDVWDEICRLRDRKAEQSWQLLQERMKWWRLPGEP